MKILSQFVSNILSNFREIDRSANILRVFLNEMSKGQVNVAHNRASSGDQVARVTVINIFSQNVSESSSIITEDKNIILKAYSTKK